MVASAMNRVVDVEIWALTLFSPMIFIVITHCAVCLCDCLDGNYRVCSRQTGAFVSPIWSTLQTRILDSKFLWHRIRGWKINLESSKKNPMITKYKMSDIFISRICSKSLCPCNYKWWILKWFVKFMSANLMIWQKRRNCIDVIKWNWSYNFAFFSLEMDYEIIQIRLL